MYRSLTMAMLIDHFGITSDELKKREEVGSYIHSFSAMIAERFYTHYLLKDQRFQKFLSYTDVPRLMRLFSDFLSSLFIHPFDERMFDRIRQVGDLHISMGMSSLELSRGFDILSQIIIELSSVNTQIRDDLGVILRFIRLCELIMKESYQEALIEHHEDRQEENEVLSLFDKLFASLMIHKQSQEKLHRHYMEGSLLDGNDHFYTEATCPFTKKIEELKSKQGLLESFGVDLNRVEELHREYHEALLRIVHADQESLKNHMDEVEKISSELYAIVDKPLSDISTTAFLGVHSGIEFLQSCAASLHDKTLDEDTSIPTTVTQRLHHQLIMTMGWCLEDLYIGGETPEESERYDVFRQILLKDERINIAIEFKEIPNKTYMIEIVKILLEIIKQNFVNKEREHALIQMVDQVERASQSKDMFLANMSHELRTPLNAIIGFSQILRANASLPDNLKPFIEKIGIAGNNLLTLVNTILDFAKLEAGKISYKPEVSAIEMILRDVATIIESMATKKSIVFSYPQVISLGLYLDRQLIHQVLLNLLSNAIKFTPEGGQVEITLDYDEVKRQYRFGVCDNGIGIDAKDIATLFDPFTQVENPFQKSSKGTGLGLAISKKIIEDLHGGKLWVESRPQEGSKFYFTIPIAQTQNTVETYLNKNHNAPHILIVEDAPEYQKMLLDRLGSFYTITMTNSVNKTKELIENETFAFMILDFFLVDGISSEILNFMESNGINVPFIIISAEDDSKLITHLPHNGNIEGIFNKVNIQEVCDYLVKQVN